MLICKKEGNSNGGVSVKKKRAHNLEEKYSICKVVGVPVKEVEFIT